MPREIDERKKQKALRKLRKAAALAEQGLGPELSDWEREFLEEVEERIETYGSAFGDPEKGDLDEPMSTLQLRKLKEIDKKARGKEKPRKPRKGFGKSKATAKTWGRDIHADLEDEAPAPPRPIKPAKPKLVRASDLLPPDTPQTDTPQKSDTTPPSPARKTGFTPRIIEGGKKNSEP